MLLSVKRGFKVTSVQLLSVCRTSVITYKESGFYVRKWQISHYLQWNQAFLASELKTLRQ